MPIESGPEADGRVDHVDEAERKLQKFDEPVDKVDGKEKQPAKEVDKPKQISTFSIEDPDAEWNRLITEEKKIVDEVHDHVRIESQWNQCQSE